MNNMAKIDNFYGNEKIHDSFNINQCENGTLNGVVVLA